ncbi:hypothetical protein NCAS_0A12640 [Naumovozyma castellii]|uniref:4a-hydroxytetrahydrobiopterin dehydratase n=1 Tax=Naumovozyma castellii TaxID=27288 RepID=G0V8M3_NAUCA|nr:hypothetical protein NCAS_0A12640 [Naumovozyma castellii CBS 4309]CCC67822.1 hypothetical protein NCAS_0A12640 [Naumovozyma castellii CBS 4309]
MYNKITKCRAVSTNVKLLPEVLVQMKLAPQWTLKDESRLCRETIKFKDFETTWSFLNQLSMRAHLWGHHPTISTTYNKVDLELTTHDIEGGPAISDIDIKMAKRIEHYVNLYK